MILIDRFISSKYSIGFILLLYSICWYSVFSFLDIDPDTADFWVWSRNLDWGYLEHPPLMAAALRMVGFFFSDIQLGLKISNIFFSTLLIFFSYVAASLFFDRKTAIIFVLLLITVPYFSLGAIIWNPNKLLLLFWILCLVFIAKLIKKEDSNWIIPLCLFIGLGLQANYSMVMMIIVIVVWFVANPSIRKLLITWRTILGILIIAAVVLPNIVWNYQNEWVSFRFYLNRYFSGMRMNLELIHFLVYQVVIFSIVLSIYFWWHFANRHLHPKELADEKALSGELQSFLGLSGIITLLLSLVVNVTGTQVGIQFLNVSYCCFFLLLARFVAIEINHGLISRQVALFSFAAGFTILLIIGTGVLLRSLYIPISLPDDFSFNHYMGWQDTADQIEEICYQNNVSSPDYIISDEHQLSSVLSLYMDNHPQPHSLNNQARNQWSSEAAVRGNKSILVCTLEVCQVMLPVAAERFDATFNYLGEAKIRYSGKVLRKLKVFVLSPE